MTAVTLQRLPGRTVVRSGRASVVVRVRGALATLLLALLAVGVACVSVSHGELAVPLRDVVPAALGAGDPSSVLVVQTLRLPRALVGLLVGAALGLSGALTSGVLRNPLATPDVLGVSAGASVGAVGVVLLGWPLPVAVAALLGAGAVAAVLAALSWRDPSGARTVLVGVALATAAAATTSFLLSRADISRAEQAVAWLSGSLDGRGWEHVRPVALALLVLAPVALLLGRALATLGLGDDLARGLGARVGPVRAALLAVAVALAAVAVAAAGPVAFLALLAPQVALRLTRAAGPPPAASAAAGALLVVAADVAGRRGPRLLGAAGTELPVGVVTALLGAPVLLVLLRRALRGRVA